MSFLCAARMQDVNITLIVIHAIFMVVIKAKVSRQQVSDQNRNERSLFRRQTRYPLHDEHVRIAITASLQSWCYVYSFKYSDSPDDLL